MVDLAYSPKHNRLEVQGQVAAGADTGWIKISTMKDRDALLSWHPGSGGTMTVEYTIDSEEAVDGDTALALTLISATADDAGDALPSSVTAVKFGATTQPGDYLVVV